MSSFDLARINARIEADSAFLDVLRTEIGRVIIGQHYLIDRLLIGLLCGGHVLLEGVPGLAKTLTVSTLARVLGVQFQRIQFTPDLLPADLLGTLYFNQKEGTFSIRKGPIFANLILADEINRAPAKVQSALLESMQERQVTLGDTTFRLPEPFLVLATQNPIEQEGTYPLPEAQLDRFMLKLQVNYPSREEELAIMRRMARTDGLPEVRPVATSADILRARQALNELYVDERVEQYIVDLVVATRTPEAYGLEALRPYLEFGASPRATIYLNLAARAHAFLEHRPYVTPDDVRAVAPDVLRHRLILSYEAEAEAVTSDLLIEQLLAHIPVP
ncbi:MAG: MoxR family ATPase [Rhodothermus sp.]|nr:MoxR family ATPase [Rhodothermus sp.]